MNCIYRVVFDVKMLVQANEEWVQDEIDVQAGLDAIEAITKARSHVDAEDYPYEVIDFRLREVRLLAEAEI